MPVVTAHRNKEEEQQEKKRLFREYKCAFTTAMIVITTVIFYSPMIICVIIESFKGKDVTDDFKWISQPISVTFINLQSLVNPLIMSLQMSNIRKSVKKKLFCSCTNTEIHPITAAK